MCAFNFCLFHQLKWPLDQLFSEKIHLYCDLKYIVVEFIWLYLIIIVWITFLNYLGTQHKSPHCILDQSLWIIFAFLTSIFIPLPVPLHLVYLIHHLTVLISIIKSLNKNLLVFSLVATITHCCSRLGNWISCHHRRNQSLAAWEIAYMQFFVKGEY